jgi:putative ABC transport system permease protein
VLSGLLADLRFALRMLRKSPGFAVVAVLSLAIGVGVNSSVYAMAQNILVRPVPWANAERVVSFEFERRDGDLPAFPSGAQVSEWARQAQSLRSAGAVVGERGHLTDLDQRHTTHLARVPIDGPRWAGIRPLHGRLFDESDAADDAEPVALIGERLWRKRYGADPALVGRSIMLDDEQVTIIGIVPAEPWYPGPDNEIVTPLKFGAAELIARTSRPMGVFAWLAPGADIATAQSELDLLLARQAAAHPTTDKGLVIRLVPIVDAVIPPAVRTGMAVLLAGVGFVLLIVCANLANLLLARASARGKELAVRVAVGASPAQIVRQLLLESLLLGLLALPPALLLARWTLDLSFGMVPEHGQELRSLFRFNVEGAAYGALAMFVAVFLFGLSPALHATKLNLSESLKEAGSRGTTSGRHGSWRTAMAVGQVSLALALLVAAGLLTRSFMNLQNVDPGFHRDNVLVTSVELMRSAEHDPSRQLKTFASLLSAAAGLPGVDGAAVGVAVPFSRWNPSESFELRGLQIAEAPSGSVRWSSVSTTFFDTLGIERVRGRCFAESDSADSAHVAVVNTAFVERFMRGHDPLGKRVALGNGKARTEHEVVGVVGSVLDVDGLRTETLPRIYLPFAQRPSAAMDLVLRGSGVMALGPNVRRAIQRDNPSAVVTAIDTMDQRLDSSMWRGRLFTVQMIALGVVALMLAAIGIYGVINYWTRLRVPEFGIRLALGATPSQVAGLVLRQIARIVVIGSCVGLALAYLFARALRFALYGLQTLDPLTVLATALLLATLAVVSGLGPARRAMRTDPMSSLRSE